VHPYSKDYTKEENPLTDCLRGLSGNSKVILLALGLSVEERDQPLGLRGDAQLTKLCPLSLITSLWSFVQASTNSLMRNTLNFCASDNKLLIL
jgi:hypothetical protein